MTGARGYQVTSPDAGDYTAYRADCRTRYHQYWRYLGYPEHEAKERADKAINRRLPADGLPPDNSILIAKWNDTVLGVIWLGPEQDRALSGWIYDLYVQPQYRRRGIARDLLQRGSEVSAASGNRRLGLNVLATNWQARRLYESEGYSDVCVDMAKHLEAPTREH